ncbi:MAG TPA: lytic transglycosylase domain-containing protein [Conexibacter sp.]|jgi:soluble lytic murein transglycosylase
MTPPAAQAQGARRASARQRAARRRRRAYLLLAAVGAVVIAVAVIAPKFRTAVQSFGLPLNHASDIRRQAADKGLDPTLIAGVIFTESKFVDQTSSAGALGLMQLMPETARFIAQRSGGTAFTIDDLSTPGVNIAYGSWYLRYLLQLYDGDEVRALAAYNGGIGNVDKWVEQAQANGRAFSAADIPFPETRAYVERVEKARREYAKTYPSELGIG